jgi:hypothetical protein
MAFDDNNVVDLDTSLAPAPAPMTMVKMEDIEESISFDFGSSAIPPKATDGDCA